jgi:hypothetical protein
VIAQGLCYAEFVWCSLISVGVKEGNVFERGLLEAKKHDFLTYHNWVSNAFSLNNTVNIHTRKRFWDKKNTFAL